MSTGRNDYRCGTRPTAPRPLSRPGAVLAAHRPALGEIFGEAHNALLQSVAWLMRQSRVVDAPTMAEFLFKALLKCSSTRPRSCWKVGCSSNIHSV